MSYKRPSLQLSRSATHSTKSFLSDASSSLLPPTHPEHHPPQPPHSLDSFFLFLTGTLSVLGAGTSCLAFHPQDLAKRQAPASTLSVRPTERTSRTLCLYTGRAGRGFPGTAQPRGPDLRLEFKSPGAEASLLVTPDTVALYRPESA